MGFYCNYVAFITKKYLALQKIHRKMTRNDKTKVNQDFDVIIIGGSYAGLSAAMALGRSLRRVLIIDGGEPCNRQTPFSHNFVTGDGISPAALSAAARQQVLRYDTVRFERGEVEQVRGGDNAFEVIADENRRFSARKLLFATGLRDTMPPLEGFAECWGISILHCPYCHGYEVKGKKTGILASGDGAMALARLISNWTDDIMVFTNGDPGFSPEQEAELESHGVTVEEKELSRLAHKDGKLEHIVFADGSRQALGVMYARPGFRQRCDIPGELGCEISPEGFIKVDQVQRSTVPGVYAAGDNSNPMRAVSVAVASGTMAGAMLNNELINW